MLVAAVCLLAASLTSHAPPPGATLSRTKIPATGKQASIVNVERFGRYAVTVKSAQGVSLQLVSRMTGPGEPSGEPGVKDGRIDAFLDLGDYEVLARADPKGKGDAALEIHTFRELSGPTPPMLVEEKPVEGTLEDFQQISWWLKVESRDVPVVLEAAGRNLADLRLWKDGAWLADVTPSSDTSLPAVGQPLTVERIVTRLEPGLYLLTAYGGPGQPWAEQSDAHPFWIRMGIPKDGIAARARHVVGPTGFDRYLVPGQANYFRIELPEAKPAKMEVRSGWSADSAFSPGASVEVTKKSLPPVAETNGGGGEWSLVTITAPAGQPYVLQHFDASRSVEFHHYGDYWISSIHSGAPGDSVDATAILVQEDFENRAHLSAFRSQTVELDASHGWQRRFNALADVTVFFHVTSPLSVDVIADKEGAECGYRFEPFMTDRPAHYKVPPFRPSGSHWGLDPGYWLLTIHPEKKGILDLTVRPRGTVGNLFGHDDGGRIDGGPPDASVRFGRVPLSIDDYYLMILNDQPEVTAGAIVRQMPLDLVEPLPLTQKPGETITVPFTVPDARSEGTLTAIAEDGSAMLISLDGGPFAASAEPKTGPHGVEVRGRSGGTTVYSLGIVPKRLKKETPLPPLPDTAKALLPNLPLLTEKASRPLDLARGEHATFLMRADAPALYRLETSGLLATTGTLRSRVVLSLDRESQNGVGRNFLVQQYLREGDYQVTVGPDGLSRGHAGLALTRTHLLDGGELADGIPARISVPAGDAVVYRFTIPKPGGKYRLQSFGLGKTFRCRLEDGDGWPLVTPNGPADFTQEFEPGDYRLVVLPEPVDTRQLTRLRTFRTRPAFAGHGPHELPVGLHVTSTWTEPVDGERAPDVWLFTLPAPAKTRVELSGELEARILLLGSGGSATEAGWVAPRRGFYDDLPAGRFRLEVKSVRPDNQVDYVLRVRPDPLLAGHERKVSAPIVLPVAVGERSLVQLSSYGATDVRARLYDSSGSLVASNDDRPDDWNFHLARSLDPGVYQLHVDPVGTGSGLTYVSMDVPREVAEPALALPVAIEPRPADAMHLYPLSTTGRPEMIVVSARSAEGIGIALETADGVRWRTLGTSVGREAHLEVPLGPGDARYRLRLWSVDRRGNAVVLRAAEIQKLPPLGAGSVKLVRVAGFEPPLGVAAIALPRPGVYRVTGGPAGLRASATPGRAAAEVPEGVLVATGDRLWLAADLAEGAATVTLSRAIADDPVTAIVPESGPMTVDLPHRGGPVVTIASARGGQPGVTIVDRARGGGDGSRGGVMGAGPREAIAVALSPSDPAAVVWPAAPVEEPLEVKVESVAFAAPAVTRIPAGVREGTLDGTIAFDLPSGTNRLRISGGERLVAALSRGGAVEAIAWGGGAPLDETEDTAADRVTLCALSPGRFRLEVLPAPEPAREVSFGTPLERALSTSGVLRLAWRSAGGTLHVRGASSVVAIGADGTVRRGTDLPAPAASGTLLVEHGPGEVLAWIDRDGDGGEGLWGSTVPAKRTKVSPPASLPLAGGVQELDFDGATPRVVHLRSTQGVVARLVRGDAADVELHPRGLALDAYLPAGSGKLFLRGLGGTALSDLVDVTESTVTEVREGLGPEVLLSPGDTRVYSFLVKTHGPVGLGVRADSDVVRAALLDSSGRNLGSGVVQMPTLDPGTYLLALHLAEDAAPARVRPAVVGLEPPGSGPPQEVIRRYLIDAGLTPPGETP